METPQAPPKNPAALQAFVTLHGPKVLAWSWAVLGVLLLVSFCLSNFRIANLGKTGVDVVGLAFEDTGHLRQMTSEGSYLLMVAVPVSYVLLGGMAIFTAIRVGLGKGARQLRLVTGATLVVLVMTVVGLYVIGDPGHDVQFLAKFLPRPDIGYHLALVWQVLLFFTGVVYDAFFLARLGRKAAAKEAMD